MLPILHRVGFTSRIVAKLRVSSYLAFPSLPQKRRYFSVALSLKSPSPGVTRHPCPTMLGLSSNISRDRPAISHIKLKHKNVFFAIRFHQSFSKNSSTSKNIKSTLAPFFEFSIAGKNDDLPLSNQIFVYSEFLKEKAAFFLRKNTAFLHFLESFFDINIQFLIWIYNKTSIILRISTPYIFERLPSFPLRAALRISNNRCRL